MLSMPGGASWEMVLKKAVQKQVKNNLVLYFLVLVFFAAGIAAGAFTVDALSSAQKEELINYFQSFFTVLDQEPVQSAAIFKQSLINNSQFVILIWLLGITVIGIPLILLIVGIKGFIVGFSVSFLVEGMGLKGLLFAVAAILPQNLFIVPGIIAAAVLGISFSISMLRRKKSKTKKSFTSELAMYSMSILLTLIILLLGSLVEGYITPVFMKFF
jgi:stage II sporulation protein M